MGRAFQGICGASELLLSSSFFSSLWKKTKSKLTSLVISAFFLFLFLSF